jgi:hypothetical protein
MQKLSDPNAQPRSRAASRARAASNPWLQYSEFFANKSFLIPDTIAFSRILPYFQALPNFSSRFKISLVELVGYEAYFVEQWISSRSCNSLIVTYTGDRKNKIIAYHVLSLAAGMDLQSSAAGNDLNDEGKVEVTDNWPPKFISYLVDQLESPFCVATETSLGYAFITNLTQLNPFLSLINAKTGNIADDYLLFTVNYNFRKVGCGSRSAATTDEPTKSMEDKFKSAFKIDGKIPINYAALNLISIMQTFLHYYGLLDPLYCDGLLCEKTEAAIDEWWALVLDIPLAVQLIKMKPPSCSLPDSIQAIIGFTVLCRYLLEVGGNNFSAPKDPMDFKKMKPSIQKFQKHFRVKESSTFDHVTLLRLMEWGSNNKGSQNITKDLSKMKKLVKNTVIDITSGKNLQSIAHSAVASPFHLYSHANYDKEKLINCQNMEHISHMSLGKQLLYLFYGVGKPIDLTKDTLAVYVNRRIAESTSYTSVLNDVKKLKNQLSTQTLNPLKVKQATSSTSGNIFDIRNISAVALNIFDKDQENDGSNELEKPDPQELDRDHRPKDNIEIDNQNANPSGYKYEDNLNQKIRRNSKNRLTSLFSSDDEIVDSKGRRKESLTSNDYIDNYRNDIAAYKPVSSAIYTANDGNRKERSDVQNERTRKERESFSSQFKAKNFPLGMRNIDGALSGEGFQSEADITNDGVIKNVHASPHAIYTEGFSDPGSRLSSVNNNKHSSGSGVSTEPSLNSGRNNVHSSNIDYDSDGVYEYEHGFEYDYEIDGHPDNGGKYLSNLSSESGSKDHYRKKSTEPYVSLKPGEVGATGGHKNIAQNATSLSMQTNVEKGGEHILADNFAETDLQFSLFCNRVKRRHSIPLVSAEMNKYSIEMKYKKDKKGKSFFGGLEREASWASHRRSIWDRKDLEKGYKVDDSCACDTTTDYQIDSLQRNRSIYESQSINTKTSMDTNYQSQEHSIIHHQKHGNHRRSLSFSVIEEDLISHSRFADPCSFNIQFAEFWTPEVFAIKYLKLKDLYLNKIVEQAASSSKNLQLRLMHIMESLDMEKNPATCVSMRYGSTRNDINKAFGRYFELEDKLKNATKSNARLKYELRLLLQRTKEVENNLKILEDFKINTLQKKIQTMIQKLKYQKIETGECAGLPVSRVMNRDDKSVMNKIYSSDGHIDWDTLNWKNIWHNPRILIYLTFHLVFCLILRRVDSKVIETRWKEIDKDQTVTAVIRELYANSEKEVHTLDMKRFNDEADPTTNIS